MKQNKSPCINCRRKKSDYRDRTVFARGDRDCRRIEERHS